MKRITTLCITFALGMNMVIAKPIAPDAAKNVATIFYKQNSKKELVNITLAYTEFDLNGLPVYYAFNVNGREGFVIIAADDAAHPVIGYSTNRQFTTPEKGSAFNGWMESRKAEITLIRKNNFQADKQITREWAGDFAPSYTQRSGNQSVQAVAPLVQTTWNQSPYYNALCPGGSVTGCVATAMAQIMYFWQYPAQGIGSSSYCDCTSNGMSQQYGTLSANYGTTTYNWSNMPLNVSSPNNDVATLMYDCGVSVDMNYSPSGSGAWVITADNPICAQNSYVTYFGYNGTTINGLQRSNFTDPNWITTIENDLIAGRPVQYVGTDPNNGGHTWVCDGFDASNNLHMNWGWGGYSDGYFSINNLNPGSDNFSQNHEALVGIQPQPPVTYDAGITSIISPTGTSCTPTINAVVVLKNYGSNTLTSATIKFQVDNNTVQNYSWSGSLVTNATVAVNLPAITVTAGTHTFTSSTFMPNGQSDLNTANDQTAGTFNANSVGAVLPLQQGFEGSSSLPTGWSIWNPDADAAWQVVTTVAHTGTNCIGFNNCNGDGATTMAGKKDRFYTITYDFSSASSATMNFDVAYAPCLYQSVQYNDTLVAYYSTDCGATWNNVYQKSGSTLATAPTYSASSGCWAPTSAQWRTETVNLNAIAGQSNVMFAWENRSGWGEWIYLDNINITALNTTGILGYGNNGFVVYPNPASGNVTIEGGDHTGKLQYAVFNMSGQEVKTGTISTNTNSFKEIISVNDMPGGMYFLKINDEKNTWVKKLTINN